jgi:hypothetical protein
MQIFKLIYIFVALIPLTVQGQSPVTWGSLNHGIQMSITISNPIIQLGKTNMVICRIKNTSTNTPCFCGDPQTWIQVSLIDNKGRKQRLTFDPSLRPGGGPSFCLNPHESNLYQIPIVIHEDNAGEKHVLVADVAMDIAVRRATKDNVGLDFFQPVSNSLEVQFK